MGNRSDTSYPADRSFTDRDGVFHPAGQTVKTITVTGNRTLTANESGSVVICNAADVVVTLPATQAGLVYTIVTKVASAGTGTSVSPNASDNINGAADDTDLVNTGATDAVGDSVTVVGDGAAGWLTTSVVGTWA